MPAPPAPTTRPLALVTLALATLAGCVGTPRSKPSTAPTSFEIIADRDAQGREQHDANATHTRGATTVRTTIQRADGPPETWTIRIGNAGTEIATGHARVTLT